MTMDEDDPDADAPDADSDAPDADADAPDTDSDADSEADPFDALDPEQYRDRPGDPFDHLGDAADDRRPEAGGEKRRPDAGGDDRPDDAGADESSPASESGAGSGRRDDSAVPEDPFTYPEDAAAPPGSGDGESPGGRDGESPGGRDGERESDDGDGGVRPDQVGPGRAGGARREGNPFESGDSAFTQVDVDRIDPDEVWESLTDAESAGSVTDLADETVEVSKHDYCETCEHFSPPPEVSCGHEGTQILEFVDMDSVRVVNCPIVAERRELGHDDAEDI